MFLRLSCIISSYTLTMADTDIVMSLSHQKRPRRDSQSAPQASSKKARTSPTAQQSKSKSKKGKKGWSIPIAEVPQKARGLQVSDLPCMFLSSIDNLLQRAFHLHIRILWGLFSQDDVPPSVSPLTTKNFEQRFESSDDIHTHIENLVSSSMPASRAALTAVAAAQRASFLGRGQIAKDANRVQEAHLLVMFNAVTNLGLTRWQPDVLGTVESMYNALHEHLAISTFKTVAIAFGYTFMNADLSYLSNFAFLVKLYRSFTFGIMAEKARKEGKVTGGVAMENDRRNMYRRRDHVC